MWIEETNNGKFKFRENYKDPYTGKWRPVSVTMDKNTPRTVKAAQKFLIKKCQKSYHN